MSAAGMRAAEGKLAPRRSYFRLALGVGRGLSENSLQTTLDTKVENRLHSLLDLILSDRANSWLSCGGMALPQDSSRLHSSQRWAGGSGPRVTISQAAAGAATPSRCHAARVIAPAQ